jgi:hypothetical protein
MSADARYSAPGNQVVRAVTERWRCDRRPYDMHRSRALGWALAGALLTACTATHDAPSPPPTCSSADLTVTWTAGGVRAQNTGTHPCALAGTHPVIVRWWRIDPGPAAAVGTLAPGATLLQAYRALGSNGCPFAATGPATARLAVNVEGHQYLVEVSAQVAHEVMNCAIVAAESPRILTGGS